LTKKSVKMVKITLKALLTVTLLLSTLNSADMKKNQNFVPQWAKKAYGTRSFLNGSDNGDPDNDPTLKTLEGSWPHDSIPLECSSMDI
jgi:hypothetical protein